MHPISVSAAKPANLQWERYTRIKKDPHLTLAEKKK
jgi:hypothetical protein